AGLVAQDVERQAPARQVPRALPRRRARARRDLDEHVSELRGLVAGDDVVAVDLVVPPTWRRLRALAGFPEGGATGRVARLRARLDVCHAGIALFERFRDTHPR